MRKFFKVIYNIIRGTVRTACMLVIVAACCIIKWVTFEPGTKDCLTERKVRRIRTLSRMKIFFLNLFPAPVNRFLGLEHYKEYINEHLRDGLQLRYQ